MEGSTRFSVVRGLAMSQGLVGCLAAYLAVVTVWSPGGTDRTRALATVMFGIVVGVPHVALIVTALRSRRLRAVKQIRTLGITVLGVLAFLLLVVSLVDHGSVGAAVAVGSFLLPMPVAIVVLTRGLFAAELETGSK